MGLLEDIQTDVAKAFDTDLADAVRIVQFATSESTYDEDTMTNSVIETLVDVRVVKVTDKEGENIDDVSLNNTANFLALSNEMGNATYSIGTKIIYGTEQYKIEGRNTDQAKATYEFLCRRFG